jgi:signal transduction histidine kinase
MAVGTDQKPNATGLSILSENFLAMREDVLARWEKEVRARVKGARELLSPILFDTLPLFYDNIAEALTPGFSRENATSHTNAASAHGGERARMTPFGPDQVVQEYQIFRESIAAMARGRIELGPEDWNVVDESINAAVVEAIRAFMLAQDALRKRVAASLSHDMRTPLAVIANGASYIGMAPDLAASRRAADRIGANARRLSVMVGELLDVLTDQSPADLSLQLSSFDIQEVVKAVADEFNEGGLGAIEAAGESVTGHWCKTSMRRSLDNLASNAYKYGDGGLVKIRASETHGRLVLSVHNSGNHIPEDRHEQIFEYLQRGEPTAGHDGWGIGLQFVKSVAESHGGSVSVDSSRQAGTTFLMDIPVDCRPFVREGGTSSHSAS